MFLMAAAIAYRYSRLSKGNDAQHWMKACLKWVIGTVHIRYICLSPLVILEVEDITMAATIKNIDSAVTWPRYQTKKSEGSRVPDYIQSSCRSFIRVIVPYERGYETSGSPLRFMLRRSSLVECGKILHKTLVYCVLKKCKMFSRKLKFFVF
jgi:hypothetical protein